MLDLVTKNNIFQKWLLKTISFIFTRVALRYMQDLLVYKVTRPIRITLNKCFLKIMGCPFWGGVDRRKGTWGKCPFYRGRP